LKLILSLQVLQGLCNKGFFQQDLVLEIEECLKDRVTKDFSLESPVASDSQAGRPAPKHSTFEDVRQIDRRIEEDRERHKRLRETMWAVPAGPTDKPEWEKLWEETSDWGSDDDLMAKEEREMKEREWSSYCTHYNG